MYKFENKIENINYYVVSDKHLVYKQNDNITYKNKILEKEVKDDIILTGDNIFYNKGNGFIARKLINNDKAYFDNYAILNAKPMYWQKGIIIDINDNQLYLFDKFNFIKEKINIIDYNWGIIFLGQEYILINDISKISSYHIPTAQPLWQFDLSQFGTFSYGGDELPYKVVHFVGIWKNNLLVQLTNNRLIAIDINTGKLVNDTQNRLNIPAVYKNTLVKMHLQGDTVHWLATFAYIQIHLNNFQVELKKDFTSTPENQRLEFSHNTLYDDKLYFVAGSQGSSIFKTHTGVFDILKNEVVWSNNPKEQLQKGEILKNEAPKVTENKLYVPGNKGTLLIFEKTNNEQV